MPPRAPPAVCSWPDCGREYATKRDLQRHQLSHGAPQFACNTPGCDRKFYRRDALLRHQRNKTCSRRIARREKGDEEDEDNDAATSSTPELPPAEPQTRRPQRTDSLESSSSSSRSFPSLYHQSLPPLQTPSVTQGVEYEDDEEEEDEFEAHLAKSPSSPIRSSHLSRRYSGPYEQPPYPKPRSPVSTRTSYGFSPSSYGPPPLAASYYDATNPIYVAASLHEHRIYGNTSNARGAIGGDDLEDTY